jgi:hypothetical protein
MDEIKRKEIASMKTAVIYARYSGERQIRHIRIWNLPQRNCGTLLQMQYPKEGFDEMPQGSYSQRNTGTAHCGRYRQGLG